jgi:hypothetical protein
MKARPRRKVRDLRLGIAAIMPQYLVQRSVQPGPAGTRTIARPFSSSASKMFRKRPDRFPNARPHSSR